MDLDESLRQREEELQRVSELRLLDDDFMTMVFAGNIEATELLLNIILDRTDMVVTEVIGQKEIKNVSGRSVCLDIYAIDPTDKKYDVEIQRKDNGASVKRARYNSSMMDTLMLKPGQKFDELVDAYVIFITENDVMGEGLPLYHLERCNMETKERVDDGSHIIYVNGAYEDENTNVGKLMHDFRCRNASEMHFKVLSDRVRYFKENEGGSVMGNVFDDIRERSEAIGEERGSHNSKIAIAEKLLKRGRETYDEIADLTGLSIEEVNDLAHKEIA